MENRPGKLCRDHPDCDLEQCTSLSVIEDNQKELLQNCEDLIWFTQPTGQYIEETLEHVRIEQRKLTAYQNKEDFLVDGRWHGLIKTIYQVEREVLVATDGPEKAGRV